MAIPKKGSRVISVDGKQYRWLIRRKVTYTQSDYEIGKLHVAVEGFDSLLCTLVIYTDRKHPKEGIVSNVIPVIPSDIEVWIRHVVNYVDRISNGTYHLSVR